MDILYDHQIFCNQRYGGISRYFYEIVTRISKEEDVTLFCGYNNNKYGIANNGDYKKVFSKKRCISRYGMGRLYNYLNKRNLHRISRNNTFDIYHPTYYDDYELCNGKLIVTVYDMIHEIFPQYFGHDNTCERKKKILAKADGIIAISQQTKLDLMQILGIDERKIKVIYLANSLFSEKYVDLGIEDRYLLYVGNRSGYKNFASAIKAFASSEICKDVKFICFGGGEFSQEEKTLIKDLNIEKQVELFFGNDDVLATLYKNAELFIYPSEYEGFGLPPLEAMNYGVPVVCSNVSSIPEVVGEAGAFFDPASADDIKEKIEYVLLNDDYRTRLINLGYQRTKQFSWERCAKETLEFYEEILER